MSHSQLFSDFLCCLVFRVTQLAWENNKLTNRKYPANPPGALALPTDVGVETETDIRDLVRGVNSVSGDLPTQLGEQPLHHVAGIRPHVTGPGWAGLTGLTGHPRDVEWRDPLRRAVDSLAHPGECERSGGHGATGGAATAVQLGVVAVTGVQLRPDAEELVLLSLRGPHRHDVSLQ